VAVTITFKGVTGCKQSGVENFGPCDFPPQFRNGGDQLHFGLATTQGCKGACQLSKGYASRPYPPLY
jgi:hypothetical protein